MGHVEQSGQVCIYDLVPLLRRHLVKRRIAGDARVIHQYFDRAQIGGHLGHASGAVLIRPDVPFIGLDSGFRGKRCGGSIISGIGRGNAVASSG